MSTIYLNSPKVALTPSGRSSALSERIVRLPARYQRQNPVNRLNYSLDDHVPVRGVTHDPVVGLKDAFLLPVLRLAVFKVHRVGPGLMLRRRGRNLLHNRRARCELVDVRLDPCLFIDRSGVSPRALISWSGECDLYAMS